MPEEAKQEHDEKGLASADQALLESVYARSLHEWYYLGESIVVQFIIAGFIGLLIHHFLDWKTRNSIYSGLVIWTLVFFLTPVKDMFFFISADFHATILSENLKKFERERSENDLTEFKLTRMLRETGPGLQGKRITEKFYTAIDLGRILVIRKETTVVTKDNVKITFSWQMLLTPLRTYLSNYARYKDDAIILDFTDVNTSLIQGEVRKLEYKEVLDKIATLKELFKNVEGGPKRLSEREKARGVYTNNPILFDPVLSKAVIDSLEEQTIARNRAEAANILRETINKGAKEGEELVSRSRALNLALAQRGVPIEIKDYNISGLEHLTSGTVVFPSGGRGQGGGGGGGKNKDKDKKKDKDKQKGN